MMYDPEEAIMNGSPAEVMAWQKLRDVGKSATSDPLAYVDALLGEQHGLLMNTVGVTNPNDAMSVLSGNIASKALTGNSSLSLTAGKYNASEFNKIRSIALGAGTDAISLVDENGKSVTNNLADNKYDTNKSRQEITMENLTNKYSAIKETLGYWGDIIKVAIEAIGALILTKVVDGFIGKGISALSGIGPGAAASSSGGLFSALGAAGPIGLGIAAVGASVAAGVAIGGKLLEVAGREQGEAKNDYANQYAADGYDTSTANTLGQVDSIVKYDKGSFLGTYKTNISSEEKDALGIKRNMFLGTWDEIGDTKGKAFDNGQWYKYNNMAWLRTGFAFNVGGAGPDEKQTLGAAILYAIALDQMNMLGTTKDTNPLLNWGADIKSKEDIGNAIRAGIQEGYFTGWSSIHPAMWVIKDDDAGPRNNKGALYTQDIPGTILTQYGFKDSDENDKYFMSHRLGLNYVPYDNYPALLHEGETVLEQNTANQLRHMINKYEDSEQQSANFREAIQEQTRALVERLDSILNIMSTENTNRIIANEMNRIQSSTDGNIISMVPAYNR